MPANALVHALDYDVSSRDYLVFMVRYSLFCGGLAPSGDTSLCDIQNARTNAWTKGDLMRPVREISGAGVAGPGGGPDPQVCDQ